VDCGEPHGMHRVSNPRCRACYDKVRAQVWAQCHCMDSGIACIALTKAGQPCKVHSQMSYAEAAPLRRGSLFCHTHRQQCAALTADGDTCKVNSSSTHEHAAPLKRGECFCAHHRDCCTRCGKARCECDYCQGCGMVCSECECPDPCEGCGMTRCVFEYCEGCWLAEPLCSCVGRIVR
jgi:hypothetical protein